MATTTNPLMVDPMHSSSSMSGLDGSIKDYEVERVELHSAEEETLIRLLRTKMKSALAEAGYDQEAQNTVSDLVEKNVASCGIALSSQLPMRGDLFEAASIQSQLRNLISGGFNVNSNEPVLLILIDGDQNASPSTVQALREASCTALRDTFHIYPVRVYVACQPKCDASDNPRSGFSLALLNVVNSNIGGPSMIQLLDDYVSSPDWERMIISKEAWNRTDLLWQYQKPVVPEMAGGDIAAVTEALGFVHEKEHAQLEPAVDETENRHLVPDDDGVDGDVSSDQAISRRTSTSEHSVVVEHPALAELRIREADRLPVQHPSWDHTIAGDSLLDLIRTQASTIKHSDSDADPVDVEDDTISPNASPTANH